MSKRVLGGSPVYRLNARTIVAWMIKARKEAYAGSFRDFAWETRRDVADDSSPESKSTQSRLGAEA